MTAKIAKQMTDEKILWRYSSFQIWVYKKIEKSPILRTFNFTYCMYIFVKDFF